MLLENFEDNMKAILVACASDVPRAGDCYSITYLVACLLISLCHGLETQSRNVMLYSVWNIITKLPYVAAWQYREPKC